MQAIYATEDQISQPVKLGCEFCDFIKVLLKCLALYSCHGWISSQHLNCRCFTTTASNCAIKLEKALSL